MDALAGLIAYGSVFFSVAVTLGGLFFFVLSIMAALSPSTVTDIAKDSVTGTTYRIERDNRTPFNQTCRVFWVLIIILLFLGVIIQVVQGIN